VRRNTDDEAVERDALKWLINGVADLYPRLWNINNKLEAVLSNQDELDARTARILASNEAVANEVAGLKAQIAAGLPAEELNFDALDAAIAGEEALEAPAAPVVTPPVVDPPVDVPPVDVPPVVDPTPVVDPVSGTPLDNAVPAAPTS
jgi:hypothetical protein